MPDEQHSGKWAAEVYDFVRLFQRDGKRYMGLLFLQLGWLLFVILLTKLAATDRPPYVFEFVVPRGWVVERSVIFKATTLYLYGAIGLCIFWIVYSRIYLYVIRPAFELIRRLAIVLFFVFGVLLSIGEEIAKGLTKVFARTSEKRKNDGRWPDAVNQLIRQIWMRLLSSGNVGIAPILAYSYDEDFRAAKLPLQIFAGAAEQCRLRLQPLGFSKFVRFSYLPVSTYVSSTLKARWLRHVLGLDVLMWGSFSGEDLWINIERKLLRAGRRKATPTGKIQVRYMPEEQQIFDYSLNVDFPAIAFRSSDPEEAYMAIGIVTLGTFVNRRRLPFNLSIFDQLSIYEQDVNALTLKLLMDVFFKLPDTSVETGNPPRAKETLAILMGRWARLQLQEDILTDHNEKNHLLAIAYLVERKCVRMLPRSVDDLYGLGALAFFLGYEDEARDVLKTAGRIDQSAHSSNPIMASVYAGQELLEGERLRGESYAWARFAAYATRSIYTGSEFTKTSLKEDLAKNVIVQFRQKSERPISEVSFIESLLLENSVKEND